MVVDPFVQTNHMSTKIFALADGHPTPDTTITMLEHNNRKPARTVNMVPVLVNQSLISGGKFAEAGYISVCNMEEFNICNIYTAKSTVSGKDVLIGW